MATPKNLYITCLWCNLVILHRKILDYLATWSAGGVREKTDLIFKHIRISNVVILLLFWKSGYHKPPKNLKCSRRQTAWNKCLRWKDLQTLPDARTTARVKQLSMAAKGLFYDWFKKLAPPAQPIRCKTKTNRDLVAYVFPRWGCGPRWGWLRVFALSSHWFVLLFTSAVIGHCNCFGFTTLNLKTALYENQA